ncbi:MAG: hydrogenase subunit MbhD domain-containing protein [Spirochaetales bacterium]
MILALVIVFGLIMVGGAVAALYTKDMVSAIVASGIVSLLASVLYLVYGAPDVAMTEAAIGSALTTVVFLYAWNRIVKQRQKDKEDHK